MTTLPVQARRKAKGAEVAAPRLALPVVLFMIGLIIPFIFTVGGLRLSVYRIVLLVATGPLLIAWLSGQAGRIRMADIAVLLLCAWAALSLAVIHGLSAAVETGGVFFIETMGAYLLARCCIRTADDFYKMARLLFFIILFFLPFAIIEAFTFRNVLLEGFNKIWPSYYVFSKEPRWGLQRVQAVFEHQILFGVFCSSGVALTYMVLGYGRSLPRRIGSTALMLFTAGLSLSAGPLTGMVVQLFLIGWNSLLRTVRRRWEILAALSASAILLLEAVANRSSFAILISLFSFDHHSAYFRIHIWRYATASIADNPLFGIGLNEWERLAWMPASIDMFWIVHGVRYGVPALILTLLAFFAVFVPLATRRGLDARQAEYRLGILFCLTSFFLTGWTVHFWNATYALFVFLLGSGVWILDAAPDHAREAPPERHRGPGGPQGLRQVSRPGALRNRAEKPPLARTRAQDS